MYFIHFCNVIFNKCSYLGLFFIVMYYSNFTMVKITPFNPPPNKKNKLLNICSPSGHPICRWVCFFIWTVLGKFSLTCSPMDPQQSMGAIRMRAQTADKSITVINQFLTNMRLFASQDTTGWIVVMFLSAVRTLIVTAPIHCRGSIGEQVMCY